MYKFLNVEIFKRLSFWVFQALIFFFPKTHTSLYLHMNFKVRKNNNIFVCVNIARYFFQKYAHNICRAKLHTYFSLKWPAFRQISLLRGLKAPEGIKPLACCSWFSRVLYPVKINQTFIYYCQKFSVKSFSRKNSWKWFNGKNENLSTIFFLVQL